MRSIAAKPEVVLTISCSRAKVFSTTLAVWGSLSITKMRMRCSESLPTMPFRARLLTMARRLDFWFDYSCPFAYLGSTRVQALAKRMGAVLTYKPMLLGGVFRALGT